MIVDKKERYGHNPIIEFVKDTPASALVWHHAPFTGSVDFVIPKGVRAYLLEKMNVANHYIALVKDSYSESWRQLVVDKAIRESPLPHRYYALSMFIFIKTLVSDSVKILPCILQDEGKPIQEEVIKSLKEEYHQAKHLALFEETDEQFLYLLNAGACHRQLNDDERKELLMDD